MLKVKLENDLIIDFKEEKNTIFLNDASFEWDLKQTGEHQFHILRNNRSYKAEVLSFNNEEKKIRLKVNNILFEAELKDKYDLLLEKLGMGQAGGKKIQDVKAPMPGLILDIKVKEGQEVNAGDQLLILEAMKMENIIKAGSTGVIKEIKVKKGQSVDKNQILIEF